MDTFLLVVNDDHVSIMQGYIDMEPQRFGDYDLDLLGSHDVIGQVTNALGICHFLLVVHCNHAFILHCYGDVKPENCIYPMLIGQKFTAHASRHITCK